MLGTNLVNIYSLLKWIINLCQYLFVFLNFKICYMFVNSQMIQSIRGRHPVKDPIILVGIME